MISKAKLQSKLNEWIKQQRLEEYAIKTLVDYKHAVQIFIDFIKKDEFNLDKELMLDYKDYLRDHFSINSRNKYITIINKFLKYCNYGDYTLKKFKTQRKTSIDDPILDQEHKRMLRWARKLNMEDMYLIMELFAYTGCRVSEIIIFTVEMLDKPFIKIFNKGKERTIIIRNDLRRQLKKYCKDNGITTGYIFRSPEDPNNFNKHLALSTIWRRLKKIARAAKINPNKIHAHAWRHLFAKKAKEVGIDLDELQDILGHNDIKTTAIYTQTSNKENKNGKNKILGDDS